MTAKRLPLALAPLILLVACQEEAPTSDGRSASGEVLEGTISDAMLPIDTVKSEPPLEDPEAFAKAQSSAAAAEDEAPTEAAQSEGEPADAGQAPAEEPAAEPAG